VDAVDFARLLGPTNGTIFVVAKGDVPSNGGSEAAEGATSDWTPPEVGSAGAWPDRVEAVSKAIAVALRDIHTRNARAPIRGPDDVGGFPGSWGGTLASGVVPVVPDANVLRNDILYACRNGVRTTLVTAANQGAIRLFCAEHVQGEVHEHSRDWTAGTAVAHAEFMARWKQEYLPLTRVIRRGDLPRGLLTPIETARVLALNEVDPDDVPSATLSLALGALYLTQDRAALRAVYGPDVDFDRHRAWRDLLAAGGNATELAQAFAALDIMTRGLGQGAVASGRWLVRRFSPWILVPISIVVGFVTGRSRVETRQELRSALGTTLTVLGAASVLYSDAANQLQAATVPAPAWEDLAQTNEPRMVRTRACLYTLARYGDGQMSATELADALPYLGVGQSHRLVRETLRADGCFHEPYAGRWQVGHVASTAGE
jgi:hypothetical protein